MFTKENLVYVMICFLNIFQREPGYQFELKVTGRDRTDSTATFPIALEILVADDKVNTLVGKESASCDSGN